MTGLIDFSTDAASNDVAAPPIYLPEGQPAPTLNDSVRQIMAALACWHADTSGALPAASVASGAITLATNQVVKAAASAFEVAFRVGEVNTGPCTLNIDGTGARLLRRPGGYALAPDDLVPGRVYRARWTFDLPYFVLVGPEVSRPGRIEAFATSQSIPPGWLQCDGRAVSRTAYEGLLSVIGPAWGPGDGSTTFNIPDLRGRTLFGDDMMGTRGPAGRLTGAGGLGGTITATGGAETVALSVAQMPSHGHTGSAASGGGSAATTTGESGGHNHGGGTAGSGRHGHSASTEVSGRHKHTGKAALGGVHSHEQGYQIGTAGSGGSNRVMTDLQPTGVKNGIGISDASTGHEHGLDIDFAEGHAHTVTVDEVGEHEHGIPSAPPHTHAIPAVAPHTHALTIDSAGSGQAHANVPPGAVVIWAIRA